MKIFKTLAVSLLFAGAFSSSALQAKVTPVAVNYSDFPAKTVFIKHPSADNADQYFAGATLIHFEVYKVGSKADIDRVISAFKDENVESATVGALTGDYQAFDLVLKAGKGKAWFVSKLKRAGLNTIHINNHPVVEVDKL